MAINKVIYKGNTLIDLTSDTVTSENLASGITAHAKNGEVITGTMVPGSGEGGIDTSDATATADEIFKDETAYVNGEKITGNFTIDNELSSQDDLISQIEIALRNKAVGSEPVLQEKTVSPTTSAQIITPDTGYDGLSKVNINGISTTTQATPSISVSSSGLITASATQNEGYVNTGTKSATKQLTTQAAKTITPTTSSQTAVSSGVYTTGVVTVGAIPSNYEDVGTETSAYTTKLASLGAAITALETELEGKASGGSGGGDVPTCTITIKSFDANINYCEYVNYQNGVYEYHVDLYNPNVVECTLNNAVCGGLINIQANYSYCSFVTDSDNYAIFDGSSSGSLTFAPYGNMTITIMDDD